MKAAIAGYTGLTGFFLSKLILSEKKYEQVYLVGRRKPDQDNPVYSPILTPFESLGTVETERIDAGFCLLGTTIGKAGSKENFRKVDLEYVTAFAKFCKQNGAHTFHLMSSVGADATSSNFYLRTKGEAEEAVRAIGFTSLYIYRPSMLLGPRQEFRFGEMIGKVLMKVMGFSLIGGMRKYRAIHVQKIAAAMLKDSLRNEKGGFIRYYDDMQN